MVNQLITAERRADIDAQGAVEYQQPICGPNADDGSRLASPSRFR